LIAPPFAIKYDNKRQGTINLNTISQFPVWAGLMQGHLNDDEFNDPSGINPPTPPMFTQLSFDSFIENRRGYDIPTPLMTRRISTGSPYNYDPANLNAGFPTEFGGVFRSATDSPKALALRNLASTAVDETNLLRRRSVHGSLLRGGLTLEANETPPTPPAPSLFVRDGGEIPLPTTNLHHDRFRNAFMRYQTLMRMPNLVSDNSQVFLIRMTLGFFELDAATQTLQTEYNVDIGQNKRYHATFVVDRSIPVGFVPGEDLNARDIVVFESYQQ
jgi:hypothetical protein